MSLKLKLVSAISLFVLMIGVLIIGVLAATQQTITMHGNVNFEVADKSLYVKDVRLQQDMNSEPTSLDNFMPGYINGSFDMNLGKFINTYGSFALYFDIINTNDVMWTISEVQLSTVLQSQGVTVKYDGRINVGTTTEQTQITENTPIDGIFVVTIISPNSGSIDLGGITIKISQYSTPITITVYENDSTMGNATGSGDYNIGSTVFLQAELNPNMVFFGWEDENGDIISSELNYSFVLLESSSTTYTALFENLDYPYNNINTSSPNEYGGYTITLGSSIAGADVTGMGILYFPSVVNVDGANYLVSSIDGNGYDILEDIPKVIFPSTVKSISYLKIYCSTVSFAKNSQLQILENITFWADELVLSEIPASLTTIHFVTMNSSIISPIVFEDNSQITSVDMQVNGNILNDIVFTSLEPPTHKGIVFYGNLLGNIYVPDESIEIYKATYIEMADKIYKLSERV